MFLSHVNKCLEQNFRLLKTCYVKIYLLISANNDFSNQFQDLMNLYMQLQFEITLFIFDGQDNIFGFKDCLYFCTLWK